MARKLDYASMFTKRKDGRYVGTYTDEKGRHYVYDKDPERLWHKLNDPRPKKAVTFADAAKTWQREHWEKIGFKTAEAYTAPTNRLIGQFGVMPLAEVSAQIVNAYLVKLGKQGYSKRSVQMHRDILNMIFNEAIVSGDISSNPCAAIDLPKNLQTTKRELPSDEALEAVKNAENTQFGLFAKVCLYAGLRRGEALALRYEDIDRDNGVIRVTKAVEFVGNDPQIKEPKTAAGYRNAVLLDVLAEAIPEGEGYIFCREDNGGLLTKTQYHKRWARYCREEIGYNITAHQLRHGFATILYEAGIDDKDAQELLGHSSITITRDVYTHIRQSRRTETANKLNQFLDKK